MSSADGPAHEIRDTYHAALRHGHVDPGEEDLVVGVVRRPSYGIGNYIDRKVPALAPPDDLLDEFKGLLDERPDLTHDGAWDEVEFGERYREHLRTPAARAAMDDLLAELETRDVWLVCYEDTDDKRCHRTILRDVLRERAETE
ncbi:DUF488 domain-containing protein [Halorussus sp. AFM4]|uniref:DUF488 domain-containing protein n=1 Tax=Halorussus sp. AFM4 TaxID=3421651 RepID=UPI003EB80AB5